MIRTIPSRSGRLGDTGDSSFGCLSWPACVKGGTLCADPESFGASLNPCCHFAPPTGPCPDDVPPTPNSDGSYGVVGAVLDSGKQLGQSVIPTWVWIAGLGVAGFVLFEGRR